MKAMLFLGLFGLLFEPLALAAQNDHYTAVDMRGDQVMGFSHEKTTHHFRLYGDGGAIEVTAKDPKDTDSQDEIRMHLAHIAVMFATGNFHAPMLIHGKMPPGVPTLERLKTQVNYRFEEIPHGGRVRITTKNKEALAAIHEFLNFQVSDHRTGDMQGATKQIVK